MPALEPVETWERPHPEVRDFWIEARDERARGLGECQLGPDCPVHSPAARRERGAAPPLPLPTLIGAVVIALGIEALVVGAALLVAWAVW